MKNDDLAEIRALLQATAAPERRPKKPAFGLFRTLMAPSAPEPLRAPRPVGPIPRRVGVRRADSTEAGSDDELVLIEPVPPETGEHVPGEPGASRLRRHAFGQRQESSPAPSHRLQLPPPGPGDVPPPDEPQTTPPRRRLAVTFSLPETPYLPGDLADPAEEFERSHATAGLFDPRPTISAPEPETDPERELLRHLERVFLVERAALRVSLSRD